MKTTSSKDKKEVEELHHQEMFLSSYDVCARALCKFYLESTLVMGSSLSVLRERR